MKYFISIDLLRVTSEKLKQLMIPQLSRKTASLNFKFSTIPNFWYCTFTRHLYLNFSQCQGWSHPTNQITIRDTSIHYERTHVKRRREEGLGSEIKKKKKNEQKRKTIKQRRKRGIKIYVYKRRYEKKNKKKMYKAWKRVKGRKGKWKTPLRSTQYASEMECKNRNCKMCNWKLGWTNAGIASDVSRRLFHYPYPVHLFFVDFFQLFETAYGSPPPLSSFRSFQRSRKRILQGNHRLGIQMIRLPMQL